MFPTICFDFLLYYSAITHSLISDFENFSSDARSRDEYLCQVSLKLFHGDTASAPSVNRQRTDG